MYGHIYVVFFIFILGGIIFCESNVYLHYNGQWTIIRLVEYKVLPNYTKLSGISLVWPLEGSVAIHIFLVDPLREGTDATSSFCWGGLMEKVYCYLSHSFILF